MAERPATPPPEREIVLILGSKRLEQPPGVKITAEEADEMGHQALQEWEQLGSDYKKVGEEHHVTYNEGGATLTDMTWMKKEILEMKETLASHAIRLARHDELVETVFAVRYRVAQYVARRDRDGAKALGCRYSAAAVQGHAINRDRCAC